MAGDLHLSPERQVALARFLTIATFALCRQIAGKRLPASQAPEQVAIMLAACKGCTGP